MVFVIGLLTFAAMECVAWFTHKYVMHGLLWYLHKDHHRKTTYGLLEKNDYFFLIFAVPAIIALFFGVWYDMKVLLAIGGGITAYGIAYFFVHDIFIHRRFVEISNTKNSYLRAIRKAHKVHHKHLDKEDGECFGMLWVPLKYYREAIDSKK